MKEYLIEFNQMAMANAEGSDDMLNRVMTKVRSRRSRRWGGEDGGG